MVKRRIYGLFNVITGPDMRICVVINALLRVIDGCLMKSWILTSICCSCVFLAIQPPRSAHPHVRFSCLDAEPMVIDKVPFDKYELEPSPLTQYILERKSPHTCWQVRTHHQSLL